MENQKEKPEWIEKVKATHRFHVAKLKENRKWTIKQTAKALGRAIGPVSEELKLADWLRTHSRQLEEFDYIHEAIEYVRQRRHIMLTEDVNLD